MSLYLVVFDSEENELEGVECGRYADFNAFRDAVAMHCIGGSSGNHYPRLLNHSDSDGVWAVEELARLSDELQSIDAAFAVLPPVPFHSAWQLDVAKRTGLVPESLRECFIDVDGQPLLERLLALCAMGIKNQRPIEFN